MMKLTKDQAVVISAYTGFLVCRSFSDVHEAVEKKLGRPVFTHEFPSIFSEIQDAFREDFISLVPEQSE